MVNVGSTGINGAKGNAIVPNSTNTGGVQFTPVSEYIGMAMQEYYNWVNNSAFYATAPPYLKPFFWKVQNWEKWINGIVPTFHNLNKGIVPTHFAKAIVDKVSALVYGGGLSLASGEDKKDSDDVINEALAFAGEWKQKVKLSSVVQNALKFASGLGTTCFKLNADAEKELWLEAVPMNRAKYDFDHNGQIVSAKFYMSVFERGTSRDGYVYGLYEHRYYAPDKEGKKAPYCDYRVYRIYTNTANQQAPTETYVKWEDLEHWVRKQLKECYSSIRLDTPIRLPLTNLGLFPYRWTDCVSSMPHLKYGDSVLEGLTKYLCEYDILSAIMDTEMYLGRGRVVASTPIKNSNANNTSYNSGLDSMFLYVESMSTEGEPFKFIQPAIRSEELKSIRNTLLENVATAIGISPSSFAPYLQDSGNRTAREVSAEESATTLFVENKREGLVNALNDMLNTVMRYYGKNEKVVVAFSKAGQSNYTLLVENATTIYQAGGSSLEKYVRTINPDMDEGQIADEVKRIREEQSQGQEPQFNDMDYFGGMTDDSEQTAELASDSDRGSGNTNSQIGQG
jgi:hypothetical protein